jgi:hypothetical protein
VSARGRRVGRAGGQAARAEKCSRALGKMQRVRLQLPPAAADESHAPAASFLRPGREDARFLWKRLPATQRVRGARALSTGLLPGPAPRDRYTSGAAARARGRRARRGTSGAPQPRWYRTQPAPTARPAGPHRTRPPQRDPEADAAWRLLQFCWNRSYAGTWQALTGHQWSAQVGPGGVTGRASRPRARGACVHELRGRDGAAFPAERAAHGVAAPRRAARARAPRCSRWSRRWWSGRGAAWPSWSRRRTRRRGAPRGRRVWGRGCMGSMRPRVRVARAACGVAPLRAPLAFPSATPSPTRANHLCLTARPQVTVPQAALLLGLTEADVPSLARSLGWDELPAAGGAPAMLRPRAARDEGAGLDSRAALERLTQYMADLES